MDALLLQALRSKQKFKSLRSVVPDAMMSSETTALLAWYGAYFDAFPEREHVDPQELESLVRIRSGQSSPESVAITVHLVHKLNEHVDDHAVNGILGQLYDLDLSGRTAALVQQYQNGAEINLTYELGKLAQTAQRAKSNAAPTDFIRTPIGTLLAEVSNDQGLKFRRIAALRDHIAGLQGGASIAIAARPDKGKTSLIADSLVDFAPQIVQLYGDKRPILWGNNEGSGKRIIPRLYQAALRMTLPEIIELSNKNGLEDAYAAAIGGVRDLIRVKDIHGASLPQIEQIIEEQRPAVMVLDMIANVRLGGPANGSNKADAVEQVWQEWRELMVRYDCIGLATVQISNEGGNMLYPPYSALKDSKTGVQGATDVILMMGSLDNPEAQALRGLSSPKNKFAMPGRPSCLMSELYFDGARCSFNDGSGGQA